LQDQCLKIENGNDHKELLKATKELYELRVSKLGEGNENTMKVGKRHAIQLQKANRGGIFLLVTSKRVLGPHHNTRLLNLLIKCPN
jgi:hypothetical protein